MIRMGVLMTAQRNSILEDTDRDNLLFHPYRELGLYNIQKTQNDGGTVQPCIVYWSTTCYIGGVCA